MIKHVNFHLYKAHPDEVIWKKLTIGEKHINKRVRLFIHHICLKRVKKKLSGRNNKVISLKSVAVNTFAKCVYETQKIKKLLIRNFNPTLYIKKNNRIFEHQYQYFFDVVRNKLQVINTH